MRSAGIIGLGKALPERILTNHDLEKIVDTSDEWIFTRTGIRERRIAADDETSSSLGAQAAAEALQSAGVDPMDVDLVICATISPDMQFPATASLIQDRIGCKRAAAFDLGAGCSGFAYALAVASQLVASGAYDNVLAIGADVLTRDLDWTDRSTCVLFGDGAGAALVSPVRPDQGVVGFDLGSDGSGAELLKIEAGGSRRPASDATLADKGHCIKMDGREVFKFAVKIMGESVERALAKSGIPAEKVDLFVPHQANIRIIDSATRRVGIPTERVFVNVEKYGNTSAASIPIALYEAYNGGVIHEGDTVVTVGFGAGLTWAACVMVWAMATVPQGASRQTIAAGRAQ